MQSDSFIDRVVMGLRLIYRVIPIDEKVKLRHSYWLAYRLAPVRRLMRTAERQVLREIGNASRSEATRDITPQAVDDPLWEPAATPLEPVNCEPGQRIGRRRCRPHLATRAVGYVPYHREPVDTPEVTLLAFYLPQFHPIPENDRWWGKGFTEWANVGRAISQVEGQYQPHLPGELGYYDLRVPEVQERQVQLAKDYGIGGFCFHFYWFGGKRLLEKPLLQYLDNPACDLPFCLSWANENWTRRWDGYESDVLIAQQHSPEDDIAFIDYVATFFADRRYVRFGGKPVLIVYRPSLLPDARATAQRWRERCRKLGVGEIFIALTSAFDQIDPAAIGYDGLVEFPPNNTAPPSITDRVRRHNPAFSGNVYDWSCFPERSRNYAKPAGHVFRGVNPGWDNEARKPTRSNVFVHASPRGYEEWLGNAMRDTVMRYPRRDERLVFINAWNEWAEGAHLEPDTRYGYAYLAATRRAVARIGDERRAGGVAPPGIQRVSVVIHVFYPELLDEIFDFLARWDVPHRVIVTTVPQCEAAVLERMKAAGVDGTCRVFENRGRDVLPFFRVANELADAGEGLILKLHTKRSLHRVDGDLWRRDLLTKLIAPDNARRLFDAFGTLPSLGMVAPEGHVLPMNFYWGSNQDNVRYLCRLMGIAEADPAREVFAAGSMFWMRTDALRPLLDLHLDEAEFEPEEGQVDGTMAHAIERCFALAARKAGRYLASSDNAGADAAPSDVDYAYAESSR